MLSAITYQLGQNQLDVLMDFMKEPGLLPMSKYRVIEAVAHIVITHPARREEVMDLSLIHILTVCSIQSKSG